MGQRDRRISLSITRALFADPTDTSDTRKPTLLARILALFTFIQLKLTRYNPTLFTNLRSKTWSLDADAYRESFRSNSASSALEPVGDLGYSGSTFFRTGNGRFLIKSLPRPSEYRFFARDLLLPYAEHMRAHPDSLLVRITDFLVAPYVSLGAVLGLAPPCHIVMENILYGKEEAPGGGEGWETYDLKPITYFYPERDIAGGRLASESTKERLVDKFEDVLRISEEERVRLLQALQADTKLLEENNAVDYSLFLVRYPAAEAASNVPPKGVPSPSENPSVPPSWRLGLQSSDGKWVYRLVVLDFFWAKHKTQAKAMTGLIKSFNFFARKGPMSITTDAVEYRRRFLHMVEGIVVSDAVLLEQVLEAGEGQGPSAAA